LVCSPVGERIWSIDCGIVNHTLVLLRDVSGWYVGFV
jgi:hypothetical protein